MNNVTYELIKKAEEYSFAEYSKRSTGKTREHIMLQKFAELIVEECASIVDEYVSTHSFYYAGNTIRKHFDEEC
jgi:hypothetical protein